LGSLNARVAIEEKKRIQKLSRGRKEGWLRGGRRWRERLDGWQKGLQAEPEEGAE